MGTHNDGKKITVGGFNPDAPYWKRREGDREAEVKAEEAWDRHVDERTHKMTCVDRECDCWGTLNG